MQQKIKTYLNAHTEGSPLAIFRVLFGLLMLISIIRFWHYGWIETVYINTDFHFKYYGFEWIKSLGKWNYILFSICGISSLSIMLGYKYVLSCVLFFLSFTYIELIDKTTYLNHYYFISIIAFILIFLPANHQFSLDNIRKKVEYKQVPRWTVDIIKIILLLVYFYAGLAKINSDWLIKAVPISIWLPGKYDLPIIGHLMSEKWLHYTISWGGMLYDLLIGFFLFSYRFRNYAFILVIIFHIMTYIFFPSIGMFPFIMICATIIFLDSKKHNAIIIAIKKALAIKENIRCRKKYTIRYKKNKIGILTIVLVLQMLVPLRHILYNGELFWTEEGYRFSWRVMLIEKSGHSTFTVIDNKSKKRVVVINDNFLTPFQEKQMSCQPDFILEYAHKLGKYYRNNGFKDPSIYVDSYVTLNGRLSKRFIKRDIDLLKEKESFKQKGWILPFKYEIKGF